jgi:hypothetical protein
LVSITSFKNILGEQLALKGYHVLQPYYYGSGSSSLQFSIHNSMNTLRDVLKSVGNNEVQNIFLKEVIETKQLPVIAIIGQSFGSNIIQSYPYILSSKTLLTLISPVPPFPTYNSQFGFDPEQFVDFIERGFPYLYRIEDKDELQSEFSLQNKSLSQITITDKNRVLIIQGNDDYIPPHIIYETFNNNENCHIETIAGKHSLDSMDQLYIASIIQQQINIQHDRNNYNLTDRASRET